MKYGRSLVILAIVSKAFAFLPQYYQTADVNPGETTVTPSLSGGFYSVGFFKWDEGPGLDVQIAGRFLAENWSEFARFGYVGGMFNKESIGWLALSYGDSTDVYGFPNGGLGMHIQVTDREFPFAVLLSAEFPSLISLGLILGVKPRNLDREIISLGAKSLAYYPGSVYLNIHPTERIHLTVGAST